MAEAIILAFLAAAKAELEFLCTPAGQVIATDATARLKTLQERIDHLWGKLPEAKP